MEKLLSVFKALSDRNRLRVFAALTTYKELCACQIIELLEITGATASRHMSTLLASGLVISRKEGRWVYYSLNNKNPLFTSVLEWILHEFENDSIIEEDRKILTKITTWKPEDLCRKHRGEKCCPKE